MADAAVEAELTFVDRWCRRLPAPAARAIVTRRRARIALEVNRAVVPRAEYARTALRDGDAVEIIHFVGGG